MLPLPSPETTMCTSRLALARTRASVQELSNAERKSLERIHCTRERIQKTDKLICAVEASWARESVLAKIRDVKKPASPNGPSGAPSTSWTVSTCCDSGHQLLPRSNPARETLISPPMSSPNSNHLIEVLKATLRHLESSADLAQDDHAVIELRRILQRRIDQEVAPPADSEIT